MKSKHFNLWSNFKEIAIILFVLVFFGGGYLALTSISVPENRIYHSKISQQEYTEFVNLLALEGLTETEMYAIGCATLNRYDKNRKDISLGQVIRLVSLTPSNDWSLSKHQFELAIKVADDLISNGNRLYKDFDSYIIRGSEDIEPSLIRLKTAHYIFYEGN